MAFAVLFGASACGTRPSPPPVSPRVTLVMERSLCVGHAGGGAQRASDAGRVLNDWALLTIGLTNPGTFVVTGVTTEVHTLAGAPLEVVSVQRHAPDAGNAEETFFGPVLPFDGTTPRGTTVLLVFARLPSGPPMPRRLRLSLRAASHVLTREVDCM